MAKTYEPIATQNGTGSSATITFSSIPSIYTDLILVASFTVASVSANLNLYVNGVNTGGAYSSTRLEGTGSSAISGRSDNVNTIGLDSNIGDDTTAPSIQTLHFMNYSNTTTNKTILSRQAGYWSANPGVAARVSLWRNTAAINSITLTNGAVNFTSASTFTLYGIKGA